MARRYRAIWTGRRETTVLFQRTAARLTQERDMKILVMLAAVVVSTSLVLPTVAQAAALI